MRWKNKDAFTYMYVKFFKCVLTDLFCFVLYFDWNEEMNERLIYIVSRHSLFCALFIWFHKSWPILISAEQKKNNHKFKAKTFLTVNVKFLKIDVMVGSKRSTDNILYSLDCFADLLYKTSFSYAIIFRPAQRYFLFKKTKRPPLCDKRL